MQSCDSGSKRSEAEGTCIPRRRRVRRRSWAWMGFAVAMLVWTLGLGAQGHTSKRSVAISGVVMDPSGAVVRGAAVMLVPAKILRRR